MESNPWGAAPGGAARASFSEEHQQLAAELLEPFAVALENDRRASELTRLREAAEADYLEKGSMSGTLRGRVWGATRPGRAGARCCLSLRHAPAPGRIA